MVITSIRIKINKLGYGSLGTASIQLDNCLFIHNIKLYEYKGKRYLSFPNTKMKKDIYENGEHKVRYEYSDLVHPSNTEFRRYVEDEVFKIYDMEVNNSEQSN